MTASRFRVSRPLPEDVGRREMYASQWSAIVSITQKFGCTTEALRRWVRQAETDRGRRAGVSTAERERLKQLERENRELRRANEILGTASAYLPKRSSTGSVKGPCRGRTH